MQNIHSDQNPSYKVWRSLLTGRGIRKRGKALIGGKKNCLEVVHDFGDRIAACLLPETEEPAPEGLSAIAPVYRLAPKLFRALDPGEAGPPILVVRVPEMPVWNPKSADAVDGCTLFIPFQDPVNVGAVLRSAAGFGVHRAVLLKESAHPFHPRSVQAGGSALFRVPLMRGPALSKLETGDLPCFALDMGGEPLRSFRFPDHFALVPGLEGTGMPSMSAPAQPIHIPMAPGVDSLNAAIATAIALYHWRVHVADVPDS